MSSPWHVVQVLIEVVLLIAILTQLIPASIDVWRGE